MRKVFQVTGFILICAICFLCGNFAADTISVKEIIKKDLVQIQGPASVKADRTEQAEENVSASKEKEEPVSVHQYAVLEAQQKYSFTYQQLTPVEQSIYVEILHAIYEFDANTTIYNTDKDVIGKVFQCILNDHPEIFYVEGYTFTEHKAADNVTNITFSAIYNMTQDEAKDVLCVIEEKVDECIKNIPEDAGEYEKVKFVYEYLIKNTDYDMNAPDNQNICSVFLHGRSVCQGYAKATQYLLQKCGIVSTLVLGEIIGGNAHAWNLVQVDGQYYYVDTTWGDASYQIDLKDEIDDVPTLDINYDYLCVTTEQISKTHSINNVVGLPQCTCLDANYYVREGVYFTQYNEEQLKAIFDAAMEKRRNTEEKVAVTIKASDFGTYTQLKNTLIVTKQVFQFLDDTISDSITYLDNENQYSITFWL